MYRRRILCTLYGAVDFLNVLKKGWGGGGVVEVHSGIHYVPLGTPSNAPRNDVARLKTITYPAIKTTGTLIVIIRVVTQLTAVNCERNTEV
jgi:hypothetical protein